ncbi:MAG: T9SS type A sorting domain-containing protein [Bacteroidia bacterium]
MKIKKITLFVSGLLIFTSSFAQISTNRTCGTKVPDEAWENWLSSKVKERAASRAPLESYTIPIIIHIIHRGSVIGTGANISNAQAISQVAILNADYGGTNTDIAKLPAIFSTVKAGDTGIRFCLAKTDPNGNVLAEPGIDRINGEVKNWEDTDTLSQDDLINYFQETIKPNTIWNAKKYLNVWISDMSTSHLLGYASFPSGTPNSGLNGVEYALSSGVVINQRAWGNIGTVSIPYDRGRTATHEIGHWLGLRHIWGDDSCGTDYCNDTPPQETYNFGSPIHPHNIGACTGDTTGEMFMNYMDYVNDSVMIVFSADQRARMQATMANGYYRKGLKDSHLCDLPFAFNAGIETIKFPAAKSYTCLNTVTPTVQLINEGTTPITTVSIKYAYDGGVVANYSWAGTLTKFTSIDVQLPVSAVLPVGPHSLMVATSMPNGSIDQDTINDVKITDFFIGATQTIPFIETFENVNFAPANWTIVNPNEDATWSRDTTVGGFGASQACAVMDNYYSDFATNDFIDDIQSPKFDLSGLSKAMLTFDIAYQQYDTIIRDSLAIFASIDCGTNWDTIYKKGGPNLATKKDFVKKYFVPTASDWRKDSIDLTPYLGKTNVSFIFRNISDWGQPIYLDNINITGTVTTGFKNTSIIENSLAIYPNPSNGSFNLIFNSMTKSTYNIKITNTLGQVIYQEDLKDFTGNYSKNINIANYGKGVYTVSINNADSQSLKKVIVY